MYCILTFLNTQPSPKAVVVVEGGVNVVVVPEAGGSVVNVQLDGGNISTIADGVYAFAASSLSSGFHTLSITTQDAAGNQATVTEDIMVVGSTSHTRGAIV